MGQMVKLSDAPKGTYNFGHTNMPKAHAFIGIVHNLKLEWRGVL